MKNDRCESLEQKKVGINKNANYSIEHLFEAFVNRSASILRSFAWLSRQIDVPIVVESRKYFIEAHLKANVKTKSFH